MNRKEFIQSCTYACLSGVAIATLVQSCKTTKHINGIISNADLIVNESEFRFEKKGVISYHSYIIVQNDQLQFPICLYRLESSYKALYLQCTHQGAELQVYGEKIVCPAHGSEFNQQGGVENGPASENLRSFPITIVSGQIKISLKA